MSRALNPANEGLVPTTKSPSRKPDRHILQLSQAMVDLDEGAYREFFRLYYKRLYSYLAANAGDNRQHVEDILQISLSKIVRHIKPFDSEQAFWNWVCLVSRNTQIDTFRKEGSQDRTIAAFQKEQLALTNDVSSEPSACIQKLEHSLTKLPEHERSLVQFKYIEGLTYSEIAQNTHSSEKAIESKLARIRKKLRTLIGMDKHHG